MPLPRSPRALASALIGILAVGASVALAAPASAASTPTDVKDPSCVSGDARALCAPVDSLLDVRIGDVHPTQPSLGYDEVYYKLGRYDTQLSKDANNKKFDDWCEANGQGGVAAVSKTTTPTLLTPSTFTCTVPVGSETAATIEPMKTVVIGPKGVLYLTDGHHTLTSFFEDSGPDVHVRLRVLGNLSGLSDGDFWAAMTAQKWTWLRDVDGNPITPAQLPTSVGLKNFQDDRYRSILYFARDIGYTADGDVPFQEFYWGSWLRTRADIPVLRWNQNDQDASVALVKQISEAQVALGKSTVVDTQSGYTAGDLSVLTAWNDGKKADKGEWAKLIKPYSDSKPGKLAYMTQYRTTHGLPTTIAPATPAAPTAAQIGSAPTGGAVTVTWTAPESGGSALTGYTVSLGSGIVAKVASTETSYTFFDVAPGDYAATVVARNSVGVSAVSPSTAVTVNDPAQHAGTVTITGDLHPGATVTLTAKGLAPSTTGFALEIHSTPTVVGTAATDGSGAFSATVTLPKNLSIEAHTAVVTFNGTTVASVGFTPTPASDSGAGTGSTGAGAGNTGGSGANAGSADSSTASTTTSGRALASTGSDATVPAGIGLAALALTLAGAASVLVARRRRATARR
ncbi:ParB-like protein [Microbacterium dextranolyticum]|uniref:Fibronectin type-III domain-containing protein n=1 Tax=Microbacterium dextranolyticum TaxID=36806 RepID=A0A9W6HKT1_9MICO|nr:ParB-like protein [Microbacterium dextranolyticum]MBM7462344.1 hypothetical protein [Microbacterium dextranolyticum]GLJ94594.1 hypothetical protein GCM10017591_06550 [Microbacterium dextranolyticum]